MHCSRPIARLCLLALVAGLHPTPLARADAAAFAEGARASANACTIGETQSASTSLNLLDLTGLTVWQLLDPSECVGCAGGPLLLNEVRWQFRYSQALCPLTFEVSVVGSDHAACPRPDTTIVLCPAFSYVYQATGPPPHVAVIPFPAVCCISGQAFVQVRITGTGGCPTHALAFFARGPWFAPCRSYSSIPGVPLQDSGDLFGVSPTIAVTADCCIGTPTQRPSWGRIKLLYR